MPRKASFAAALVLWLCALPVSGQPFKDGVGANPNHPTEDQNGSRETDDKPPVGQPLLILPNIVVSPERTLRESEASDEPEPYQGNSQQSLLNRDILAQESMAWYARLMTIISGIALLISVVAAIYLKKTIRQTKKLMRQDRAWITFDYHGEVSADHINFHRAIALEFFNSGKTPALEVVSRISVAEVTDDMAGVADEEVSAERIQWSFQEETRTNGVIGVGGRSRAAHTIKPAHMSGAVADGRGFFVLIRVDYKTIYETLGTRSYAGLFKVCEIRKGVFSASHSAYSVRPVGKHTCT